MFIIVKEIAHNIEKINDPEVAESYNVTKQYN